MAYCGSPATVRTNASVAWCSLRVAYRSSTWEAMAWSAIMRPNRSVEIPPTNPAGAPRRAMPTAMLRQQPPTTGTSESRPSTDLTGRKSIKASPQLSSIVLFFRIDTSDRFDSAHRLAAFPIQFSHQSMDLSLGAVEFGHSGRRRFAQTTDRRHRGHCLPDRPIRTAGHRTQHGSSEQDRLLRFGNRNRQTRRVRHDLADQRTASRTAADHHQVAVDAVRAERVDDIRKAIGEPAESRHEQPLHRADVRVEIHPCDDRARIGIGERRAIAEKLRQNVNVAGKPCRLARVLRTRDNAPLEKFQNFHAADMRGRGGLVIGGVGPYEMIDGRARRGLTAFVEPKSRNHSGKIGTPNARNEARLGRCRHDAGRGSHDVGQTTAYVDRLTRPRAPSDRAHTSGVRVDQRRADRRPLQQTEVARGRFGQTGAQRRAGCDDLLSDLCVAVRRDISKTDPLEIAAAPALFVGEEIPFAGERAYRT